MTFTELTSWRVRRSQPDALVAGLYLRDAAGLAIGDGAAGLSTVPPLLPAVAVDAELAALAAPAAAEQWAAWWQHESTRPDGAEAGFFWPDAQFGAGAELDALTRAAAHDARAWTAARAEELAQERALRTGPSLEGTLMREVERQLGRPAEPFALQISELPVDGDLHLRAAPWHLLVSRAFRRNTESYRAWLQPVLLDLAQG